MISAQSLHDHRTVWQRKPILRQIYEEWYQRVVNGLVPGKTLEIGSGTGNFKEYFTDAITSDIISVRWLDVVLDAHRLPFENNCLANVVLFDVLHHLKQPKFFFEELLRVLIPGGRAHFLEPYISPLSYPVYHWVHPEPVELTQNPFHDNQPQISRQSFDANQALPYIIFFRQLDRFQRLFPTFRIIQRHRLSLWAYPLSGGFEHRALLPDFLLKGLLRLEGYFTWLAPISAFRLLVTIEKSIFVKKGEFDHTVRG